MQIKANNLTFKTIQKTVVSGATFSCPTGQTTALLGPEGCGKKALLLMLGGYLKPSSGAVFFENENIFNNLGKYRKNIALGTIEALNPLVEDLTPRENIDFSIKIANQKSDKKEIQKILNDFQIKTYADTPIKDCSSLAQAVTSIACISAQNPEIIIMDEPTQKLVTIQTQKFWEILKNNFIKKTIIFSTKSQWEAKQYADNVISITPCQTLIHSKNSQLQL